MSARSRGLSRLREVKRMADKARKAGALVAGCSFCARVFLKPGREPVPCPVCGALVTRTRPVSQ